MNFLLVIPVLAGLVAWVLTNILADTLPYTPVSLPRCTNPGCRAPLSWTDALLIRRCKICGKSRSARTWILLAVFLVASIYLWVSPPKGIYYAGGLVVFTYLMCVAIIDLEHRLILRPLSIAGVVIGAGTGFLMRGWQSMLIGATAGFIILLVFYLFGKLFIRLRFRNRGLDSANEEALGSGDVTLAIILGLMLGWPLIWFAILLGVLLAGAVSLAIILWLMLTKSYGQKAFMVFIPIGPGFILATILILYFPHYLAAIVPR